MRQVEAIIFAEHQKLSEENPLLKQQILSLKELNNLYIKSDSIKQSEINLYKDEVNSCEKKIQKLKSSNRKTVLGASISGLLLFIIGLIL
jgi:hypothetical protein